MDGTKIRRAVSEIERLTSALKWLREYGHQLDPNECTFEFSPSFARSCPGAESAIAHIEVVTRLHMANIIAHAIKDAENTIVIHRDTIRSEMDVTP